MNWTPVFQVAVSLIVAIVGVVCALVGVVAAADPEGRGGAYFKLLPIGGVLFIVGIAAAAWVIYKT